MADPNEEAFQAWYREVAQRTNLAPNPDDPEHFYDYRAAWRAGVEPTIDPSDGRYHWPSEFKAWNQPNRFVPTENGLLDSLTDQPVSINTGALFRR